MPLNYCISFQCKHMHEYNGLLFHLFADRVMDKDRHRASPESNMHKTLVLFMRGNLEKVQEISQEFLWMTIYNTFLSLGIGATSKCGKTFISDSCLKRHELQHSSKDSVQSL